VKACEGPFCVLRVLPPRSSTPLTDSLTRRLSTDAAAGPGQDHSRRGAAVGLTGVHAAHRWRRNFAHEWKRVGGDTGNLMLLLGWSLRRRRGRRSAGRGGGSAGWCAGIDRGEDPAWPLNPAPGEPKFWPDMELDLTGAVLLDFEFVGRRVETARFIGTRFVGGANFAHAEFIRHGYFHGAQFEQSSAHFLGAWFGSRVVFSRTDFGDEPAVFNGATFAGMTFFDGAVLGRGVSFEAARALAEFERNWGGIRQWPGGWIERHLAAEERMPLLVLQQ
jgi:hypothetical protein